MNATGEDHSWVISSKDASIRNFGFLVSKKPYIYTIDDDCLPAKDNDGNVINPLAMHLRNLQTPSHPYFFNTLYDPYATGSDFVRGYPVSMLLWLLFSLLIVDVCLNYIMIGCMDMRCVMSTNVVAGHLLITFFVSLSLNKVFFAWRSANSNQPRFMALHTGL